MTKSEGRWCLPAAIGVALVIAIGHPGVATLTAVLVAGAAWAYALGYRVTKKKEEDP